MSTYTGEDIIDLSVTTPTEDDTPPSEVNDSIREIKTVYKNQNATIVKSSNYTLTSADSLVLVSGNTQITIPESSGVSSSAFLKQYTIIKTDSSATTVTIARSGSDTFNGATSLSLTKQNSGVILFGSGVIDWKALFSPALITTSIGVDTTLTAAQCNGLTKLYTTAAVVVTAPAATAGLSISIEIGHSGGLTINRNTTPGTDTFTLGGVTGLTSIGADKVVGGFYDLTCYVAGVWEVKRRGVQPQVVAVKSSLQTVNAGNTDLITFTESVDLNNEYASSVVTPSLPGWYNLTWNLSVSGGNDSYCYPIIYKNGSAEKTFCLHIGGGGGSFTHKIQKTSASDTYDIRITAVGVNSLISFSAGGVQTESTFISERLPD